MERIYLYVPPEEYAVVQASGGCWDEHSKRWYIPSDTPTATFSRWLGDEEEDAAEFGIVSEAAFVASAHTACLQCRAEIEVICIYCESGTDADLGEPMRQFTVSNIWALDDALAEQLERWPCFKRVRDGEFGAGGFANHCPHCAAVQEDYLLHDEPGDVFFGLSRGAGPGAVEFTPLVGGIRMSGDTSFQV